MTLAATNNIESVWMNVCKHEGEVFHTVTKIEYTYIVKNDYILVNNDLRRKITKTNFEKALKIQDPTCSK